jgi:hypothetical protein
MPEARARKPSRIHTDERRQREKLFREQIADWRRGFRQGPPTMADARYRSTTLDELIWLCAMFVVEVSASFARWLKAENRASEQLLRHYIDELWLFVLEEVWDSLSLSVPGVLRAWVEMTMFVDSLVRRKVVPLLRGVDDGIDPPTPAELAQFRATKAKQSAAGKNRAAVTVRGILGLSNSRRRCAKKGTKNRKSALDSLRTTR